MSDGVKSPWTLDIDLEKGAVRRVRNTSPSKDGVPLLPLEANLRNFLMGIAGVTEMLGDEFSGNAIGSKSEELAYGWARVAKENERVKIAIKWMVETSAWTEAAVPTAMVGISIGWHYGLIPDQIGQKVAKFAGLVPLTEQEEADIMRAAMAQMQDQPGGTDQEPQRPAEPAPEAPEPPEPASESDSPTVAPIPPHVDLGDASTD